MTRLSFVLADPGPLDTSAQYEKLRGILTPLIRAHGVYDGMSRIANPRDERGMVFWLIESAHVAAVIKRNVERHEPRVESCLWQRFGNEYSDHLGRWTWLVKEVPVAG